MGIDANQTEMNYLDLFAGIGGFHLGLTNAAYEFSWVGFSETDKYAKSIYQKHFPEAEDLGDVRTIRPDALPKIDILTFGFPCQDLSLAGKRKGLHSERSSLFFEAMRIVRVALPSVFIFENVPGLFSSNGGEDFTTVLRAIADIGLYECEWQVVDTAWFLPQSRKRIYFVGHLGGKSKPKIFPIGEDGRLSQKALRKTDNCFGVLTGTDYKGASKRRACIVIDYYNKAKVVEIPMTIRPNMRNAGPLIQLGVVGQGGQGQRIYSPEGSACQLMTQAGGQGGKTGLYEMRDSRIRRLTPLECERLQGFPEKWTEKGLGNTSISDTQRYKGLGNAVSVPIVAMIGRKLRDETPLLCST